MKRIYMALALVGALATGSYAQTAKSVDLKINMVSPSGTLPNLAAGDSVRFSFSLQNLGTDAVALSDTLTIILDTKIFGATVYGIQKVVQLGMPPIALAVGETSDTLGIWINQGENFFGGDPNPVNMQNDSKNCPFMTVFGFDVNQIFFNDPGFDAQAFLDAPTPNDWPSAFSGNNKSQTEVKFGSGAVDKCSGTSSILDVNGATKESLNIYPNPASDNLNFDLSLEKASNATVRVMDIAGRTVLTQELGKVAFGDHKFSINVSNLNAGTYIIEVSSEGKRSVSKFNKK